MNVRLLSCLIRRLIKRSSIFIDPVLFHSILWAKISIVREKYAFSLFAERKVFVTSLYPDPAFALLRFYLRLNVYKSTVKIPIKAITKKINSDIHTIFFWLRVSPQKSAIVILIPLSKCIATAKSNTY